MTDNTESAGGFKFMLRALRYRNYRLFFAGQLVSLTGTWMTSVATSWLVYRLTGSALLLGLVGFALQLPACLISPFAGIFVDRWNKRRILVATQTLSMFQSLSLAALTFTGWIDARAVILLCVVQGLINGFDLPCRQAFVIAMVENKRDLGNAIALNSSLINGARLLGPSLGGLAIAALGEGWCFLIDGLSYLAVIAALLAMRIAPQARKTSEKTGALAQLREGWDYAFGFPPIRSIILLLALISFVGVPHVVLMPVFVGQVLRGGPHTLGFLMAASGLGALAGGMWLASRKTVLGLGRAIPLASALFGCAIVALSFSRGLWPSLALLFVAGFGLMIQMASSNTFLQTIVDDDKRGRVMSFFMMAFLGAAPFGGLLAGSLADRVGVAHTLLLGGLSCILGALWFAGGLAAMDEAMGPVYARLGLMPERPRHFAAPANVQALGEMTE